MFSRTPLARRIIVALGLCAFVAGLALTPGCNTVKGVGRDIEAIGQGGEDIINRQ